MQSEDGTINIEQIDTSIMSETLGTSASDNMGLVSESHVIQETWIESIPLLDLAEDSVTSIGSLNLTILPETQLFFPN